MSCHHQGCLKKYDLDLIGVYALKRYTQGFSTIELMSNATTESERAHIVMATMIDLDDCRIQELIPFCNGECRQLMFEFRERLRVMIMTQKTLDQAGDREQAA
jgi:hypothetical protein